MGELRDATLQAERALIGSVLVYSSDNCSDAINYCRNVVKPTDFLDFNYDPPDNRNFRIYTAMLLCDAPQQINTAQKMSGLNLLCPQDISYMSRCIGELADDDYETYAKVVAQYSLQRQIKRLNEQGKTDEIAKLMNQTNRPKAIGVNL
jgi:hypothetical protein